MGGANYRQKNLLRDLIYLGQTKPINKQTIKGLFRFALEPLLESQTHKAVVIVRLFDTKELDGVLKRLEFSNIEVYSFDDVTNGENLEKKPIWGDTEFLVILSPRYSAALLWDYSTESLKDTSCVYQLLNSRDINDVIKIISDNSKIDLTRYTHEYTPERRTNELLNKAVHKFIDFADSYVGEASLSQAEAGVYGENEDYAQKYEYISNKAKIISHDIKNHLSVIDLYSKIIEKRIDKNFDEEDKALKDSLMNAVNSIKKSKESVSDLLVELRTIQGVNLQPHNFSKILETAINLVQAKAEEANTRFEVSNPYTGEIIADENKLLNVMINLFYNSIEAMNGQGVISIKTEEEENNMLRILIFDNGCGIEEDVQDKIFDEGYTSKVAGSGLGLYISKESMKEQYGDLNLILSDEKGTIFELMIPRL